MDSFIWMILVGINIYILIVLYFMGPRITKVGNKEILFISNRNTKLSKGIYFGPCSSVWYTKGDTLIRTGKDTYHDSFEDILLDLMVKVDFRSIGLGFIVLGDRGSDWQASCREDLVQALYQAFSANGNKARSVGDLAILSQWAQKLFSDSHTLIQVSMLELSTEISSQMPVLLSVRDSESQNEAVVEEDRS